MKFPNEIIDAEECSRYSREARRLAAIRACNEITGNKELHTYFKFIYKLIGNAALSGYNKIEFSTHERSYPIPENHSVGEVSELLTDLKFTVELERHSNHHIFYVSWAE